MLCMRVRPFDLLLQLAFLSSPVGCLLAFLFPEGRGLPLSLGGSVDPSDVDAVILLLKTAEAFAAEPFHQGGQAAPSRILEVYMVRVGNVGLIEAVGFDAFRAVIESEQIQEGGQAGLRVSFDRSAEIRGDGVDLAHMAFGLGVLVEAILVAALFGAGRTVPAQATEALEFLRSGLRRPVNVLRRE